MNSSRKEELHTIHHLFLYSIRKFCTKKAWIHDIRPCALRTPAPLVSVCLHCYQLCEVLGFDLTGLPADYVSARKLPGAFAPSPIRGHEPWTGHSWFGFYWDDRWHTRTNQLDPFHSPLLNSAITVKCQLDLPKLGWFTGCGVWVGVRHSSWCSNNASTHHDLVIMTL